MKMKTLLCALLASTMCVPVHAAPEVIQDADFGISYVSHSRYDEETKTQRNLITGAATLYEGNDYSATLSSMEQKLTAAVAGGYEVGAPRTIVIDSDEQIAQALKYVPDNIQIRFDTRAEAEAFCDQYAENIDLWISAIETWDDSPLVVSLDGTKVTCSMTYSEGWLACADTIDGLRVFENEELSEALDKWAETYLDPISELDDGEQAAMIVHVLKSMTEYDHNTRTYENGSDDFLTIHSIYGPIVDGRGVCDGYSYTFHFAAAYLEIPCFEVYGSSHAWNKVQVDGGWYVVDVANAVNSVWLTANYFLIPDKYASDPYGFMLWTSSLYPANETHPDRNALASLI